MLVNTIEKDRISGNKYKNIRKSENKIFKFWLSQKFEICLILDLEICLD